MSVGFALIGPVLALLLALPVALPALLLAGFGVLLALFGLFLAFAFTLLGLLFALFLALLGESLALFDLFFALLLLGLLGILLGLFRGLIGSLGRVFTPLVAEVALFLLLPLGLLDGVLFGDFGDAAQLALVFLYLLDAVVDFLLTLLLGFLTGFGLTLELLEVLLLGTFLSLALLIAEDAPVARDGGFVAIVVGFDFLALGLLAGFLFGFEACLLFGFGLETCLLLGFFDGLGFGILPG